MFPNKFVERMEVQLGPEAEAFFQSLSNPFEISILLNEKKQAHIDGEVVPWNEKGLYLHARPE
ncbi:MAG: hypothetical protein HKN45_03075 [Flavobacteriales bacterium]|nr:hypothetical protein [Flavobacteriales bacterium]